MTARVLAALSALCRAPRCPRKPTAPGGWCRKCASAAKWTTCGEPGCTARIKVSNRYGRCRAHVDRLRWLAKKAAAHATRPPCPVQGCTQLLRRDNVSGYCWKHHELSERFAEVDAAYRASPEWRAKNRASYERSRERRRAESLARARYCSVEGCGRRLLADNALGLCKVHGRAVHAARYAAEAKARRLATAPRCASCGTAMRSDVKQPTCKRCRRGTRAAKAA